MTINNILQEQLGILEKQILNGLKKPCQSKIIGQWHCILDDYPPFNTLVDVVIFKNRYKNVFLEKTSVNGGKLTWEFSKDDKPGKYSFKFFDDFYEPIVYWCFLPEIPNIHERIEEELRIKNGQNT